MNLTSQEVKRFYRIWWPLLRFVNAKEQIVDELLDAPPEKPINIDHAFKIRNALWQSDSVREAFIAENPANLEPADLDLVDSWRYRVAGRFYILRHLKKYTVFLDERDPPQAYGVLGLTNPIKESIDWPLPILVNAVLLPFADKIVYDGLLQPYNISFGSGIRGSLNNSYRAAQERGGIITNLHPVGEDELQNAIGSGNRKILTEFRKDLAAAGLGLKKIDEHTANLETFANDYLLAQTPPRSLLDVNIDDLQNYLDERTKKDVLVSFRRFVRFLLNSGRTEWGKARDMQDFLKQPW